TLVSVPLSGILSTGYYRHSLNNDVDVLVGGLQHLHVELDLANGQTFSGFCTAMGTLYTVQ
ncbi:MAG TPA: hypothetical protein VGF07_06340, partial [Stellaceae bacterium]